MAVLAFPWSTPALKGVGVGAMPVSLYPVPIVHRTGHPGLPNTRSVRSLCMTLPTGRMEQLSALFEALKASCCLMVAYNIHHQREINALQWGTRGWGGREAAGLQPPNSKLKKKKKIFCRHSDSKRCTWFTPQPKSAGDWYIRILKNKFKKFRTFHINWKETKEIGHCDKLGEWVSESGNTWP